jgi:hypothetical protein
MTEVYVVSKDMVLNHHWTGGKDRVSEVKRVSKDKVSLHGRQSGEQGSDART